MSTNGLLIQLLNKVDTVSEAFVFQGYQNLVSAFAPAITALIVLSLVIYGYALVQGIVNFSLPELSKRVLMIGFILAFALNWGHFSSFIYAVFTQFPNEVSAQLLPHLAHNSMTDAAAVNVALQQAFYEGFSYVKATWELGSSGNWLPFIWAMLMGLVLLLFVSFALMELVVAKFGLAIYLVLAPLMIPCFLFQPTKALIFDGWLKHLVGFALIPIFITAAVTLSLMLLSEVATQIKQAIHAHTVSLMDIVPYLLYSLICIGLVKKASTMATSLTHSFATTASHHLDHTAGWIRQQFKARKADAHFRLMQVPLKRK